MGTDKIESTIISKRNVSLDFLKLIAAYMVVFIHVPFYGQAGMVVRALARFAVPVFFMTSGYFCYQNDELIIRRKIRKIIMILIFTSLLYNAMNFSIAYVSGGKDSVNQLLAEFIIIKNWVNLLIFNEPFSATRLWFLFALIYVYILQIAFCRFKVSYRTILIISATCLVLNLTLGELFSLFDIQIPEYYVRNFLLTGYPFFGFGLLIHNYQENGFSLKSTYAIIALILGISLVIISLDYAPYVTLTLGAAMMTFASFFIALNFSNKQYPSWMMYMFECSLGIYVFHRVFTTVCAIALGCIGFSSTTKIYNTLLPVLVCVTSTLFVLIFNIIITQIKRKR